MSNNFESFLDKNKFFTEEELVKDCSSLLALISKKSLVMKDEKLFQNYKEEDLMDLTVNYNNVQVSKKLIMDLLSDLGMFKYVISVCEGIYPLPISICYIYTDDLIDKIELTGPIIVEALRNIDLKELNPSQQIRKTYIERKFSIVNLNEKYRNRTFIYYDSGSVNKINTNLLLELLDMSEDEFENFDKKQEYINYSKEKISNIFTKFINQESILKKYWFTDKIRKRIEYLVTISNVELKVPEEKNENTSEIPKILTDYSSKSYSELEQIMHSYIALARTISEGDSDYYLMLFYELITKLNLYGRIDDDYNVSFSSGEYDVLIHADDNLKQDNLPLLKLGEYAIHLDCINDNEETVKKFKELFYRIYNQYVKKIEDERKFTNSLSEFNKLYQPKSINRRTKLYLLIKQLTKKNMIGLNIVDYGRNLLKRLFEDDPNIKINYLLDKTDVSNNVTPITLLSVYSDGKYTYFLINPKEEKAIVNIDKEELETIINVNNYQYLDKDVIPGMNMEEGLQYVRRN